MVRCYFSRFIAVAFIWLIVFSCNNREDTKDLPSNELGVMPTQEMWRSEIIISKSGRKQAVIKYGHMVRMEERNRAICYFDSGVEADFYDEDGNHASHLTSERGEYHEDTDDVFGIGNVVVVSDTGTLKTERLQWKNSIEKIVSDTLVEMVTSEGDTIIGIGFQSDPDLSNLVIYKPTGMSSKAVDLKKIEDEFSRQEESDSVSKKDTIKIKKR